MMDKQNDEYVRHFISYLFEQASTSTPSVLHAEVREGSPVVLATTPVRIGHEDTTLHVAQSNRGRVRASRRADTHKAVQKEVDEVWEVGNDDKWRANTKKLVRRVKWWSKLSASHTLFHSFGKKRRCSESLDKGKKENKEKRA